MGQGTGGTKEDRSQIDVARFRQPLRRALTGIVFRDTPLWRHDLAVALVAIFIPPLLASWLVTRYAKLEPYRNSTFGRYVARHMTHAMELVRLMGFIFMAVAAWKRSVLVIAFGAAVVLFGWLRGVLLPTRARESH